MEKNISRGQLLKIKNDSNYYIYLGQFKSNVDCHLLLKHKKVNDNYVLKCIKTSDIHEINDTQFTDTYYLNNALLDKRIHTQLLHTSAKCAIKFENNKISHLIDIPKGIYGDFSKIKEEFLEFEDSINQDDKVLQICELCDLVGAIGGFVEANFNLTVNDLIKFSDKIKDLKK